MPDGNRYALVTVRGKERYFDFENRVFYKPGAFTKKNKAHYMRVRSGVLKGMANQERLDFLTLTTKYDKEHPEQRLKRVPELNYAFTKLKQQIEYYWQKKRYLCFCRKNRLKPFEMHGKKRSVKYPEYWEMFRSKMKYIKAKTAEGGGVLHIIFRKPKDYPPIPKQWLHKQWLKIWGSWNTSIHEVPYSDVDRMSAYVVGKYFVDQPVIRLSYGHQWVYCGFVKGFRNVMEIYANMKQSPNVPEAHKPFKRAIEVWNKNIVNDCLPKSGRQRSVYGRIGKDNKWHSKRKPKPQPDKRGIFGLDWDVTYSPSLDRCYHLKWWDCRLDSPKYVNGYKTKFGLPNQIHYISNTVAVDC